MESSAFDLRRLHFLTFFSKGYLPQAHVLLESILERYPKANVIACALDEEARAIIAYFPQVKIFSLEEVLETQPELKQVFIQRQGASAIFSSVPSIALNAISRIPSGELLIYLDADTALVNDISSVVKELDHHAIGLFPHTFLLPARPLLNRYGRFNAGAFVVRKSEPGLRFLQSWQRLCIDWCEDRVSGKRYSNQGYLTQLFDESEVDVKSLVRCGGDIAPWNLGLINFSLEKGKALLDGVPISFFHFHGLVPGETEWTLGHLRYFRVAPKSAIEHLYVPYLRSLTAAASKYGVTLTKSRRFSQSLMGRLADYVLQVATVLLGQRVKKNRLQTNDL